MNSSLVPLESAKPAPLVQQTKTMEGILCVDLIKAAKLVKSDLIGKSDPYAVLKFGQQAAKTKIVNNSQV